MPRGVKWWQMWRPISAFQRMNGIRSLLHGRSKGRSFAKHWRIGRNSRRWSGRGGSTRRAPNSMPGAEAFSQPSAVGLPPSAANQILAFLGMRGIGAVAAGTALAPSSLESRRIMGRIRPRRAGLSRNQARHAHHCVHATTIARWRSLMSSGIELCLSFHSPQPRNRNYFPYCQWQPYCRGYRVARSRGENSLHTQRLRGFAALCSESLSACRRCSRCEQR